MEALLREVLHKRAAERRRDEIAMDVQEARREHEDKDTHPATPDELMGEILSKLLRSSASKLIGPSPMSYALSSNSSTVRANGRSSWQASGMHDEVWRATLTTYRDNQSS